MNPITRQLTALTLLVCVGLGARVLAHPMTLKGVVAAVEPTRIQIKTGEEKQGVAPAWCAIDSHTKIFRDKLVVTFAAAKITVNERAVVLTDHGADEKLVAVEIHLAAK
jgi:hypothetical protein